MMEPLESVTKSVYIWDISGQSDKISAPKGSKGYWWTYFTRSLPHILPDISLDTEMYLNI